MPYLVHELLDARPQHVLGAVVDGREGLVDAGGGGASDVGDEVREILGDLELDLARRLHLAFPLFSDAVSDMLGYRYVVTLFVSSFLCDREPTRIVGWRWRCVVADLADMFTIVHNSPVAQTSWGGLGCLNFGGAGSDWRINSIWIFLYRILAFSIYAYSSRGSQSITMMILDLFPIPHAHSC